MCIRDSRLAGPGLGGHVVAPQQARTFREMRGCSAHPSLSVFGSDVLGFGGWLGGHEWRRSVISSNPPDEATSESESSAQSVPESVGVDPAPRPTRRSFTAAYKAEIVAEYELA